MDSKSNFVYSMPAISNEDYGDPRFFKLEDWEPKFSTEEQELVEYLTWQYDHVNIDGHTIKRKEQRTYYITPSSISLLTDRKIKLDYFTQKVCVSPRGLEGIRDGSLGVVGQQFHVLSGSGSDVLTEYWESKMGSEVISFSLNKDCYMMYYEDRWRITKTNLFLAEGAEYNKGSLWIREHVFEPFHARDIQNLDVKFVDKRSFSDGLHDVTTDIYAYCGEELVKISYDKILTLKVTNGEAFTSQGTKVLDLQVPDGVYNINVNKEPVAKVTYEYPPMKNEEVNNVRSFLTVRDIRSKLRSVSFANYSQTQWIGVDMVPYLVDDLSRYYKSRYKQLLGKTTRGLFYTYLNKREFNPTHKGPPVSMHSYVSEKGDLDYKVFLDDCKNSGKSYNLMKLRTDMIKSGMYQIGRKYKVMIEHGDFVLHDSHVMYYEYQYYLGREVLSKLSHRIPYYVNVYEEEKKKDMAMYIMTTAEPNDKTIMDTLSLLCNVTSYPHYLVIIGYMYAVVGYVSTTQDVDRVVYNMKVHYGLAEFITIKLLSHMQERGLVDVVGLRIVFSRTPRPCVFEKRMRYATFVKTIEVGDIVIGFTRGGRMKLFRADVKLRKSHWHHYQQEMRENRECLIY